MKRPRRNQAPAFKAKAALAPSVDYTRGPVPTADLALIGQIDAPRGAACSATWSCTAGFESAETCGHPDAADGHPSGLLRGDDSPIDSNVN